MKPAIVTVVLSAAAVLGYVTYRLTLDSAAPEPTIPPSQQTAAPAGDSLADSLPEFSLADVDGAEHAISAYAGRPLLINFWATWCAPCRREIPRLKAYQTAHDDMQVIGVAVDDREAVRGYTGEMQFNYPVLVGQADAMNAAAEFGVDVLALPFTVFASADGAVLGVHTGELHPEHLDDFTAVVADLESGAIDLETARARLARML